MRHWVVSIALLGSFILGVPATAAAQDVHDDLPFKVRADVVYGHKDGLALTYDVLVPKDHAKGVGLMFMVSGGWVSTWVPPAQAAGLFQPLLDAGYTIIAVRHGSSPRYVIPEIAGDVRLALDHVHEHAAEYGIDPQRLGVFGFSAGGHLSLLLGTTSNHKPAGPRVAAVAAVFPPTDLAPYVEPSNPLRERFPALKFDPSKAAAYSPLKQVSAGDAPTLLVHGDKDELVPLWHSEKIVEAFQEVKVPVKLEVIRGAAHGFDNAGNARMFDNMIRWFDEHLAAG
jgi:acetyl esterase/lipase